MNEPVALAVHGLDGLPVQTSDEETHRLLGLIASPASSVLLYPFFTANDPHRVTTWCWYLEDVFKDGPPRAWYPRYIVRLAVIPVTLVSDDGTSGVLYKCDKPGLVFGPGDMVLMGRHGGSDAIIAIARNLGYGESTVDRIVQPADTNTATYSAGVGEWTGWMMV